MQRRFILLYRHFRLRKYGEPLPKAKLTKEREIEELQEQEDTDMLKRISILNNKFNMEAIAEAKKSDEVDEISDFGSDKSSDNRVGGESRSVTSKKEARDHVQTMIEDSVITDLLKEYVKKVIRVQ